MTAVHAILEQGKGGREGREAGGGEVRLGGVGEKGLEAKKERDRD